MKNTLIRLSVFLSFVFFTSNGLSSERIVAGMVVGLHAEGDNRPEVVSITGTKPVKLLMPIYDGEQIYVNGPEQKVKVKVDEKVTVISSENSPFMVNAKATSSSVFSKVVSWVERTVNDNGENSRVINAASRGGGLFEVRFLNVNRNQLSLRKKLHFEVEGGKAPYRVHLLNQSGQKVKSKTSITESAFSLDAMSLYPSNFSLVVCDSSNCRVFPVTIERKKDSSEKLAGSDGASHVVDEIVADELIADEILQGLRYFQEGETSRLFEAYQILSAHKDSNEIAEKVLLSVN
jgi:hypothetical protein